ncbi:MAG: DMT family transporter [Alphaproteobacteria bacterium]|jgi:transporter family-2 protein|uniref:DMT family transporter n=1 Tax=Methyloceanibacter sp. TaxID=1965321 RepID=UPI003561F56E
MWVPGLLFTLVALVAGGMIALQAPINAEVATRLGHPISAATMSFVVGTIMLLALALLFARGSTNLGALQTMPLYMLLGGGLLGAIYVTVNLMLAPKIGIAAIMALGIAGQLFTALFLDRFGMFELTVRELSLGRVSGAILVLVGALMVRVL